MVGAAAVTLSMHARSTSHPSSLPRSAISPRIFLLPAEVLLHVIDILFFSCMAISVLFKLPSIKSISLRMATFEGNLARTRPQAYVM